MLETQARLIRLTQDIEPPVANSDLVIVDQSMAMAELLTVKLEQSGYRTTHLPTPSEAIDLARQRSTNPPDMVLLELGFPGLDLNGLDVMMAFKKWCPETALVVYTAAKNEEATLLRVAWESIAPACAVSKDSPVSTLMRALEQVRETGHSDYDPALETSIPSQRSPWRTAEGYRRLVPHAGHAKLWKALLGQPKAPPYKAIAEETQLSVNTIRNYRDDLLAELRLHGLSNPTMRQMHEFAHSVRPLLAPIVCDRLRSGA